MRKMITKKTVKVQIPKRKYWNLSGLRTGTDPVRDEDLKAGSHWERACFLVDRLIT